ncbi:MAG: hypothetical protein DMF73_15500 [Acidobacteria bacterium]|nr:MAG: hypothetical protein DMF73_15500 [Acidobacteriota bacterium]
MIRREFNLELQQNVVVAWPHSGEIFMAPAVLSFAQKLRRSAIASLCFGNLPLPGFAPKGARSLGVRSWL